MSISHPIANDPVPQFIEREGLIVVAGYPVFAAIYNEIETRCPKNLSGKYSNVALATIHAQQAVRGFVGAEVRRGKHGWGMWYDSGLQGFSLITSGSQKLEVLAEAERWAAADPMFRYVWMMNDG